MNEAMAVFSAVIVMVLFYLCGYIQKTVETEREKRAAKLHALQMQISPHFIYNTLASIKWLIVQGDNLKSIDTIDAFIDLVRSTISSPDLFITVRQEEKNLRSYVKINQTRYGNRVQADFYIQEDCMEAEIPKLALQPFIENAFFHAFPKERRGTINVFIYRSGHLLCVEIADDGVGMERDLKNMRFPNFEREQLTGIGIKNIEERLKLIYGKTCSVRIESRENCGTNVYIKIPFKK